MKVRNDEGVANRIGPEPCADVREGVGEASVGECTGQPLSRERIFISGADTVVGVEGNTCGRDNASAHVTRRGRRTWHARKLFARDPGALQLDHRWRYAPTARIGKARSRSR